MAKKSKSKGAELMQAQPKDVSSPPEEDPVDNYENQGHLDTLIKAHKILGDAKKMKKVHALAGRHADAIKALATPKKGFTSIADVKSFAQKKYGQPGGDTDMDGE